VKTATSSLLWTYEALNKPPPEVGSLSIVTDGDGGPGCVVEKIVRLAISAHIRPP
jgi:uncharacterized protein YhfF